MKFRNSRRGGALAVLLLSFLAVFCLVCAAGIYLAVNTRIHTIDKPGGADVSIDTPAGHLSVHAHERRGATPAGVPVYPGARPAKDSGGDALVEWTSNRSENDKGFAVSASNMITDDPFDKVVDYYRTQLPNWIVAHEKGGGVRLELREGGYKRFIAIQEEHDGTHIGVASVGEPASN